MKKNKMLKEILAVLTSLALVLSASTTTWAEPYVPGRTCGVNVEGYCYINGQYCYACTRTLNGDMSVQTFVSGSALCRNRATGASHNEPLPAYDAVARVSTSSIIDDAYEIIELAATHSAQKNFCEPWTGYTSTT